MPPGSDWFVPPEASGADERSLISQMLPLGVDCTYEAWAGQGRPEG